MASLLSYSPIARTSRPLRRRVDSILAAPIVAFPIAMKRRPASAPPVRKRPAGSVPSRAKHPCANSEMNLTGSAPTSGAVVQRAQTDLGNASTILFDKIMDQLRALGHWPTAAYGYEYTLRSQICRHIEDGVFSIAQTAEIEAMKKTMEAVGGNKIMQKIHDLGYMPKASGEHEQTAVKDSRNLAEAIRSLGRWPKRKMRPKEKEESTENNLAIRLQKAQRKGIKKGTELASVLDNLPPDIRPNVEDQVVNQIRVLGHVPKRKKNPAGEEQFAENNLARRLSRLRRNGETTQTHDVFQLGSNTDTSQTDDAAQVGT